MPRGVGECISESFWGSHPLELRIIETLDRMAPRGLV